MRLPGFSQMSGSAVSNGGKGVSRPRARLRVALVVLLGLNVVLGAYLLYRPGRTLDERQADLVHAREQRDAARTAVEQMRDLQSKLQGALRNGDQFARDTFTSRSDGFSAILEDLESRAAEAGLRPGGVTYDLEDVQDQPGWSTVEATLVVEGGYPDLLRFVHQLEQSGLFWIINGVTVAGGGEGQLRMNLVMQTYFISSS